MPYRILLRRDSSLNWSSNNPVLMTGEAGYDKDYGGIKIGDGKTPWNDLGYAVGATGPQGPQGPTGAAGLLTVTRAQALNLTGSNSLAIGSLYLITDADSTNIHTAFGGNRIILQAIASNQLSHNGVGEFFNPIYDTNKTGLNNYGIWNPYGQWSASYISSGIFNANENVIGYTNGNAFATLGGIFGTGFFIPAQGSAPNWLSETQFYGQNTGQVASISNVILPTYAQGDKVMWGGKWWTNSQGNVGHSIDSLLLNPDDWSVIPYTDKTQYIVIWDDIKYDIANDAIIERSDLNGNLVSFNYEYLIDLNKKGGNINPLNVFPWGFSAPLFRNNEVILSYCDLINFRGEELYENKLEGSSIRGMDIVFGSFNNNELYSSNLGDSSINKISYISYNKLLNSSISNNFLYESDITENYLKLGSSIGDNQIEARNIENNNLFESSIGGNIGGIQISSNSLDNASINDNACLLNSYSANINNNNITGGSRITSNSFYYDGNVIQNNLLSNISQIYSNQLYYSSHIEQNSLTSTGSQNYQGIYGNQLFSSSRIIGNLLFGDSSGISVNDIENQSSIKNNNLTVASKIQSCFINSSSLIQSNYLYYSIISGTALNNSSQITANNISNSAWNFSNIPNGRTIQKIKSEGVVNSGYDIGSATNIYNGGSYTINMYQNSGGVVKLSYYNGSDAQIIVNVNS